MVLSLGAIVMVNQNISIKRELKEGFIMSPISSAFLINNQNISIKRELKGGVKYSYCKDISIINQNISIKRELKGRNV